MSPLRVAAVGLMLILGASESALAQSVGTYRWQLQPFCNIVTVVVTQQGGIYTLDGTDNRCGLSDPASAVGVAFPSFGGTVSFGLTSVTPDGTPVHTQAKLSLVTMNGTWRDSAGNSGTFTFTVGPGTGGTPRPIPSGGLKPGSITAVQIAAGAVGATQVAADSISSENVVDGSLTIADMADAPFATIGVGPGDVKDWVPLPNVETIVRTLTITAPAAGTVILNASAEVEFDGPATRDQARCSISKTAHIDSGNRGTVSEAAASNGGFAMYAATRAFDLAAGPVTFNLVCEPFTGTVNVRDATLTSLFVPRS